MTKRRSMALAERTMKVLRPKYILCEIIQETVYFRVSTSSGESRLNKCVISCQSLSIPGSCFLGTSVCCDTSGCCAAPGRCIASDASVSSDCVSAPSCGIARYCAIAFDRAFDCIPSMFNYAPYLKYQIVYVNIKLPFEIDFDRQVLPFCHKPTNSVTK